MIMAGRPSSATVARMVKKEKEGGKIQAKFRLCGTAAIRLCISNQRHHWLGATLVGFLVMDRINYARNYMDGKNATDQSSNPSNPLSFPEGPKKLPNDLTSVSQSSKSTPIHSLVPSSHTCIKYPSPFGMRPESPPTNCEGLGCMKLVKRLRD